MKVLLINHTGKHPEELINFLSDFELDIVLPEKVNDIDPESYDFIVLSGGPIHISHESDIIQVKDLVRTTNIPIFGICLGLEIIGVTYGSKLLELDQRKQGLFDFELFDKKGKMHYNQGWFIKDISPEFEVLRKDGEIIDAIQHKTRPILAIQGHPERSGDFGKKILNRFIEEFVNK